MTVDHTFHKILVVSLLIYVVVASLLMAHQVGFAVRNLGSLTIGQTAQSANALNSIANFLASIAMLYFLPKFVRKYLMEDQ